jgi:endonuclease YncB( thermonuclease family)
MKRWLLLIVIGSFFLCTQELKAATLYGKVTEINDGDAITVICMKRPLRIQLLGIDAPEQAQPFGDVAKRHLSDLILDRLVVVEYAGIGANGRINGRVLLDGADIGAQMIRDGAAWVDESNENRLSALDREIYEASEKAARDEKRGLWQELTPVAPWQFVKDQSLRRSSTVSGNVPKSLKQLSSERLPAGQLDNLTLMMPNLGTASASTGGGRLTLTSLGPERQQWARFKVKGQHFSAFLPSEGKHDSQTVTIGDELYEFNFYASRNNQSAYMIIWLTLPTKGETDAMVLDQMGAFLRSAKDGPGCQARSTRIAAVGGYSGREFELSGCSTNIAGRAFTKLIGNKRQLYWGFTGPLANGGAVEETDLRNFLKSFTVSAAANATTEFGDSKPLSLQ